MSTGYHSQPPPPLAYTNIPNLNIFTTNYGGLDYLASHQPLPGSQYPQAGVPLNAQNHAQHYLGTPQGCGGGGNVELKSYLMINNFIIEDTKSTQRLQERPLDPLLGAAPILTTNRQSSIGKLKPQDKFIPKSSKYRSEKRLRNLSQNPKDLAAMQKFVIVPRPDKLQQHMRNPSCENILSSQSQGARQCMNQMSCGPKKHLMTEFVDKISNQRLATPQGLSQNKQSVVLQKHTVPITKAIENLKNYIQGQYKSTSIKPSRRPDHHSRLPPSKVLMNQVLKDSYFSGVVTQKHKRELSVKNPPSRLQAPPPQKSLIESRMISGTNLTNQSSLPTLGRKDTTHSPSPCFEEEDEEDALDEDSQLQQVRSSLCQEHIISDHTTPATNQLDLENSAYLSRNGMPIPAFTSAEVASKLRSQSENRYINEYMECELSSYKMEIERRFQSSSINKGYSFPRVLRGDNHSQRLGSSHATEIPESINDLSKLPSKPKELLVDREPKQLYSNKENQSETTLESVMSPYCNLQSLQRDYETQGNQIKGAANKQKRISKTRGNNSIADYKQILSKFLNQSQCQSQQELQQNNKSVVVAKTNKSTTEGKKQEGSNHGRSKSTYSINGQAPPQASKPSVQERDKLNLKQWCDKLIRDDKLMKAASIKKLGVQVYQTPSSQTALGKKSHKTFDYLGLPPTTGTAAAATTITSRNPNGQGLLHMVQTERASAKNGPSEYYYRTFAESNQYRSDMPNQKVDSKVLAYHQPLVVESQSSTVKKVSPKKLNKSKQSNKGSADFIQSIRSKIQRDMKNLKVDSEKQKELALVNPHQMQINLKTIINENKRAPQNMDSRNLGFIPSSVTSSFHCRSKTSLYSVNTISSQHLPVKSPHDPRQTGLHSYFTQPSSQPQNPKSKKQTALHTRNQSKECLEQDRGGSQHVLKLRLSNNSLIVEQRPAGGLADYGYPYLTEGGIVSVNDKSLVGLTPQANENPYYDTHKVVEGQRSTRKGQHTKGQRSMQHMILAEIGNNNSSPNLYAILSSKHSSRSSERNTSRQRNKSNSSSKDKVPSKEDAQEFLQKQMKNSESKRNFKVKCLKIDLYNQANQLRQK